MLDFWWGFCGENGTIFSKFSTIHFFIKYFNRKKNLNLFCTRFSCSFVSQLFWDREMVKKLSVTVGVRKRIKMTDWPKNLHVIDMSDEFAFLLYIAHTHTNKQTYTETSEKLARQGDRRKESIWKLKIVIIHRMRYEHVNTQYFYLSSSIFDVHCFTAFFSHSFCSFFIFNVSKETKKGI